MWEGAMFERRALCLMSMPERLRILAQSAFWKIAGPLYIPYWVFNIFYFFNFFLVQGAGGKGWFRKAYKFFYSIWAYFYVRIDKFDAKFQFLTQI